MIRRLLGMAFCLLLVGMGHSQDTLFLEGRAVPVPAGFPDVRTCAANAVNGRCYAYLSVYEIPGEAMLRWFEANDWTLGEYLPQGIYTVSFPVEDSVPIWHPGMRGIIFPTPEMKLHYWFDASFIPDESVTPDGQIAVWISFFDTPEIFEAGTYLESIRALYVEMNPGEWETYLQNPLVRYIQYATAQASPENDQSRSGQRGNCLYSTDPAGLQFDGSGVVLAINDDGDIGPHIDFEGRLDQSECPDTAQTYDHGDHVSGIAGGAGNKDPRLRGVAPGIKLKIYAYSGNPASLTGLYDFPDAYLNDTVRITSTSYTDGCNTGYTAFAQLMDQHSQSMPSLLHVFSSGNSGTSNCGYGAGAGWGNIAGGNKAAKNVITVGNVNKADQLQANSSKGPVHDGRIKPDVVAVGTTVESTTSNPDNSYNVKSGTSMSAPAVAGVLAQLYQAYRLLHTGNDPNGALIKAVVMNTADDLGNPGPDFRHGYGRVNARRAYKTLVENRFMEGTIANGQAQNFSIPVPAGVKEIRVMLYWNDKPAAAGAAIALVNNLSLSAQDPALANWLPWVLDYTANATNLNTTAVRGTDNRNNVEQVTVANPAAGNWNITVTGTAVPQGSQAFVLTYEFLFDEIAVTYPSGLENLEAGSTERVRWDSYGNSAPFLVEYSLNNGLSWSVIASNVPSGQRYFDWSVPTVATGEALIRVSRGLVNGISDTSFSILGVPQNLNIDTICGSEVMLSWNAVGGANQYEVFMLGEKYMELKASTSQAHIKLTGIDVNTPNWYAVRALGANNSKGLRTIAIQQLVNAQNCVINHDLGAGDAVYPFQGALPSCITSAAEPVIFRVHNYGIQTVFNYQLSYQINNDPPVIENVILSIAPGDSIDYYFVTPADFSVPGTYQVVCKVLLNTDQQTLNDSSVVNFTVLSGTSVSFPYSDNLESLFNCSTTPACGSILCNLNNGMINLDNGVFDDIDFRVNNGPTPSPNTGPDLDFSPGDSNGKYLYLEASSCAHKEAMLLLPCITLSGSETPFLQFAYSMVGNDIGSLFVDVFYDHRWNPVWQRSGPGSQPWVRQVVNLGLFQGQSVLIRFRGQTTGDFAGDLALDDIHITDLIANMYFPADTAICVDSAVMVADTSKGIVTDWFWSFGNDANPANSTTQGPHSVQYTSPGIKTITLTVTGPSGTQQTTRDVYVNLPPVSAFSYVLTVPQVSFSNTSSNGLLYSWEFGDGGQSSQFQPIYQYTTDGLYPIQLIVDNGCGRDTAFDTLLVEGVGLPAELWSAVQVFPNPASQFISVSYPGLDGEMIPYEVLDMTGKTLLAGDFQIQGELSSPIAVHSLAKGVYLLRIGNAVSRKWMKIE